MLASRLRATVLVCMTIALVFVGLDSGPATAQPAPGMASAVDEAATALAAGQLERARPAITRAVEQAGRRVAFAEIARRLVARNALAPARALILGLARTWLREGAPSDAVAVLTVVADPEPHDPRIDQLLGEALVKSERHESALIPLLRARELGQASLSSRLYLALAYWETGDLAAAEDELRLGLAASGQRALWHHQLGRLLLWQGHGAEAVEALERASEHQTKAIDLMFDLGRARVLAGDLAGAEATFLETARRAPEFSQVHYSLGQLQRRLGRMDEAHAALATFQRLHEAEREQTRQLGVISARLDQGWDLLRQGRATAALDQFSGQSESVSSLQGMAASLNALDRTDEATAALERAVLLAPDDPVLRQQLAGQRLAASEKEAP